MTYYYIYKITCTAGSFKDHYYIGQHKTENLDDGYKGSGVKIQKYYQKYPYDYKKEILCWCKDEEDMNLKEDFYVGDLYKTDHMCLNLKGGGNHAAWNKGLKGVQVSPNKGKTFSEEHRKKISEASKGKNNYKYGRKCMNNGLQQKYVKPTEVNLYLEKGYTFGMLKNHKNIG